MNPIVQHNPPTDATGVFEAKALGAPFKVLLAGGFHTETDPASGKTFTSIEDLPGLMAAVVETRLFHPRKLSGEELRFIRCASLLKSSKVADLIDCSPEHYSRCEAGARVMPNSTEKMFRMSVFLSMARRDLGAFEVAKRLPACERTKEKAAKAFEGVREIFFGLKIDPVYSANNDLTFKFHRRCRTDVTPCEDGEWETNDKAA